MSLAFWTVNHVIKGILGVACQVDDQELRQIPQKGPLILVCNHVNFLEVPLIYTYLQPRPITGFAKSETWDSPWMGPLFDLWGAIPVRRGEADTLAMRRALDALEQGKILAIAPEGTRSGTGKLQAGRAGVVTLALHSGASLQPIVYYGGETISSNLRRLRRTDFHIRVGPPFRINTHGVRVTREVRQEITTEIMYRMAALLPEAYRGQYADLTRASMQYLDPVHG
jgi:1-acyl-sn-glycerol-3-phosphate acyltransferase